MGFVIACEDKNCDNSALIKKTRADLEASNHYVTSLIDILEPMPSVEILEVTTMAKLGGHPFIAGDSGILKDRALASAGHGVLEAYIGGKPMAMAWKDKKVLIRF